MSLKNAIAIIFPLAFTAVLIAWYCHIPAYIRKRIAEGKDPAAKEAAMIHGNRRIALILILPSFIAVAKAVIVIASP